MTLDGIVSREESRMIVKLAS
jgi:hypothetical protein